MFKVGAMMMALLAFTLSSIGSWWQIHQQDVTYGRPRTFQLDAVVSHNDSAANHSHFIFLNLNRYVVIIEMPGGDSSKAHIYNSPTLFGGGQDLALATAEFKDVNGDGRLDMIVHIQDQTLVYINDGTQFQPLRPRQDASPYDPLRKNWLLEPYERKVWLHFSATRSAHCSSK
jgi:hypothetical protein